MDLPEKERFDELSYYTLAHPDKDYFIHQHIVDAYHAQFADKSTKPITLIFSLVGLYLYLEEKYSGRQVQMAHRKLSQHKRDWIILNLPEPRGVIVVADVLAAPPGKQRDLMIKEWCSSVWTAYRNWHETITAIAKECLQKTE